MTTQDKVKKAVEELDEKRIEVKELKQLMVSECEFKIGEKVEVWQKSKNYSWNKKEPKFLEFGIIVSIGVNDFGEYVFGFKKVKKDGTVSAHSVGWGDFDPKKIKE